MIKKILLGLTGGVAAYKAAELTRRFVKQGVEVQVVMTEAACNFITPMTMQALSGRAVHTEMWNSTIPNGMPHIELSREADAILIAPASADFVAKLAHGFADDLLSTLCLARDCPLIIAPAMNKQMWENPATQRNIKQLIADGVAILGPASGEQACGDVGAGRMLEPEEIILQLDAYQQPKLLAGKRVLITAGPTVEAIDPVRAITNFSSGKMGYSIAQAAIEMGAKVTLVSGPVAIAPPYGASVSNVRSAQQMYNAVMEKIIAQDIFISVAAVADYRPISQSQQKLKKSSENLTIELTPNPDILAEVANLAKPPFCVGFAAESENLLQYAETKRKSKKLALIAANIAMDAFGQDDNSLILLDDAGKHTLPMAPKLIIARQLLQHIHKMMQTSNT